MVPLAGALDVSPSTVGRMCDRLVRKGLVRRNRARADRRVVQVPIAPVGRQMADQVTARRRVLLAEILANLEPSSNFRGDGPADLRRRRGGTRRSVAEGPGRRCARHTAADRVGAGLIHLQGGKPMTTRPVAVTPPAARLWTGRAAGWPRGSRGGLFGGALVVGAGAGLGAVGFPVPGPLFHLAGH
jgi:MarR family